MLDSLNRYIFLRPIEYDLTEPILSVLSGQSGTHSKTYLRLPIFLVYKLISGIPTEDVIATYAEISSPKLSNYVLLIYIYTFLVYYLRIGMKL